MYICEGMDVDLFMKNAEIISQNILNSAEQSVIKECWEYYHSIV
jgi:hypothetical protein